MLKIIVVKAKRRAFLSVVGSLGKLQEGAIRVLSP